MRRFKKDKNGGIGLVALGIIILICTIIFGVVVWMDGQTVVQKKYQVAVHSYVDQAYYTNDPVLIKENLTQAEQGMRDLGLTDSMSWKFWSWEQTPSESMKAQYGQMDAIIAQCNLAIADNPNNLSYTNRITQIHNTICTPKTNGDNSGAWVDQVAEGAFWLDLNAWYAWQWQIVVGILLVIGVIPLLIGFAMDS